MKNNKLLKFRIYLTLKSLEAYTKYKNSKKRIGPFFFVFLSILFLELMTKKIMIGLCRQQIITTIESVKKKKKKHSQMMMKDI